MSTEQVVDLFPSIISGAIHPSVPAIPDRREKDIRPTFKKIKINLVSNLLTFQIYLQCSGFTTILYTIILQFLTFSFLQRPKSDIIALTSPFFPGIDIKTL